MQFYIILYIDIWEIILYLQANPNRLKTKNINSLVFTTTIIDHFPDSCFLTLDIP